MQVGQYIRLACRTHRLAHGMIVSLNIIQCQPSELLNSNMTPTDRRVNRTRLASYSQALRIPNATIERFIERTLPIRMLPDRVLELGSAAGQLRTALRSRYPKADVISIERDWQFCAGSKESSWRRLFRDDLVMCAAAHAVPMRSASVDMVCANLSWVRAEELSAVLNECVRVLRVPGLLMLVGYGPQTLVELRETWAALDCWEHMHRFVDMHHVGDAMVGSRLADVVVDSERLTVEFDNVPSLLREVRAISGGNHSDQRRRGLSTAGGLHSLAATYPDAGGYVTASVELVFAHAWLTHRPGTAVNSPILSAAVQPT
ncbi:MAG: malonyl-CoA O-methyltransferase [Gammaproteobacteria bacterium]|jgi:malonyl-CoA O-methyltransferase